MLRITPRHGPHRKQRSSVAVRLLLSGGMVYSIVVCAATGTDRAENTSCYFSKRSNTDYYVIEITRLATSTSYARVTQETGLHLEAVGVRNNNFRRQIFVHRHRRQSLNLAVTGSIMRF
jgi:hypothetical protein